MTHNQITPVNQLTEREKQAYYNGAVAILAQVIIKHDQVGKFDSTVLELYGMLRDAGSYDGVLKITEGM